MELTTAGSDFDTVLAVYTGPSLQSLALVVENDNRAGALTSRVLFSATGGTAYQIAVDGRLADSGSIVLNLRAGLPPNDFLDSATPLIGISVTTNGNNSNATAEPGEPQHAGVGSGKSVWWSWTPPYSGVVEITTEGSDFDTVLGVYQGATFLALTSVAANDDWEGSVSSRVLFSAVSGESYRIVVDGKTGAFGSVVLNLQLLTPPNDLFDHAAPLIGRLAFDEGTTINATAEPGEPDHAGGISTNSVWWVWTAPYSFDVVIETGFFVGSGDDFDTVLAVYVGDSLSSLSLVAANDDWKSEPRSLVKYKAIAGTTYHIAVAGKAGATGNFLFRLELLTPPPADFLADATPFTAPYVQLSGSNTIATAEPGEPRHAGADGGHSVWWNWIAPASGSVSLKARSFTLAFSPVVAVYTGGGFPLTPVTAYYDYANCEGTAFRHLVFDAVAGASYRIAVDGLQGSVGTFGLTLEQYKPPENDNFASRRTLNNVPDGFGLEAAYYYLGNNLSATSEPNEPAHGGLPANRSVWWSWTAPTSGVVQISVKTTSFTPRLAVYTGSSIPLAPIRARDILRALPDNLLFASSAGQTYQIALDTADDAPGFFDLTLLWGPRPPNDDFSNAAWLVGKTATVINTFWGATREPDEPYHAYAGGNQSLWYAWVAPLLPGSTSRPVTISTAGSGADTVLSVYTGSAFSDLQLIADSDDARGDSSFSEVSFVPVAGTTYLIAVDRPACPDREPYVSYTMAPLFMTLNYRAVSANLATLAIGQNWDETFSFAAGIDFSNYGSLPTGPLRVSIGWSTYCDNPSTHRMTPITEGLDGNPLDGRTFFAPVASDAQVRMQIEGAFPTPEQVHQRLGWYFESLAVFAVIEEKVSQEWIPLTRVFVGYWPGDVTVGAVVGPTRCTAVGVLRSGGVVEGLPGQFEIAYLSIERPAFVTNGSTVPIAVRAHLTGSNSTALVADPAWTVNPLVSITTNASGTNFFLTAGHVCQQTNVSITARFRFGGDESVATTNLTLLPPPLAVHVSLLPLNHSVLLRLSGPPTNRYVIEAVDALGSSQVWRPFWTNPPNGDCSWLLTIPPAAQTNHRYFRARQHP